MTEKPAFHTKSETFVDDVINHIYSRHNLTADVEYGDLIENLVRSIAVISDFQSRIQSLPYSSSNETDAAVLSGYVAHFITEVISARGFIEEIERKFLEDIPTFPQIDLLAPQFDSLYPNLQGIRNTLEHNAERRRRLKARRVPMSPPSPLVKPDGTLAKCGELVIFPPSVVKCHLSNGTVGEVDLELVTQHVCKMLIETVKRFPEK